MARFWTEDKLKIAVENVKKLGSVSDAADALTQMWGTGISRSSLRHALLGSNINIEKILEEGRQEAALLFGPEMDPDEKYSKYPELDEAEDFLDEVVAKRSASNPDFPAMVDKKSSELGLAWQRYTPTTNYKLPEFPGPGQVAIASKVGRGVILPDSHFPLVNKKSWACVQAIIKEWKPTFGVIIGDFMEMASLSKHAKSQPDLVRLSSEYYATNIALDAIQNNSPDCDWTYIEGNHEYRAKRFSSEFGMLDGMLDVPSQLYIRHRPDAYHRAVAAGLRGMRWVDTEDQPYITAHSAYYHGHHRTNKFHSAWHAEIYCPSKCNFKPLFYGHMHTFQQFTAENGCSAQCVGFLGDEAALHYTLGKPTPWVQGIVLQEVTEDGRMSYQTVQIKNGTAIFNGKIITG